MQTIDIDLGKLEPMISLPGREDRKVSVGSVAGTQIHQGFFGSCTNGRNDDIAVSLLRNNKIHPSVRMLVVRASHATAVEAARRGYLEIPIEDGATLMPRGCAVCAGDHQGVLADGEKCLSTSNRNGAGQMANAKAEIFLCSPATAVASAIAAISAIRDASSNLMAGCCPPRTDGCHTGSHFSGKTLEPSMRMGPTTVRRTDA